MSANLATRTFRVVSGFNEALYLVANEPTLGMYRIQEHVAVNIPRIVEQKQTLKDTCQQMEGVCFDVDYDTQAVKQMGSVTQFSSIKDDVKRAIELKLKLDELEMQRSGQGITGGHLQESSTRGYGSINSPTNPPPAFHSLTGGASSGADKTHQPAVFQSLTAPLQSSGTATQTRTPDSSETGDADIQPKTFN